MQIRQFKMKYQGKIESIYRVFDASGELVKVFCELKEAEEWVAAQ